MELKAMEGMTSMSPEAVRAKEQYLLEQGAAWMRKLQEMKAPQLFEDKYGEQYIYSDGKYTRVEVRKPEKNIKAEPFETFSLAGLVEYILKDPEGKFGAGTRHIVRVRSCQNVQVIAPETGYWREREVVAFCTAMTPDIKFGRYMDTEDFQIMLQTGFMESENLEKVLKLAGSVRKEQNMQTADDGVSQKVTINSGISTSADVIVKNPVVLTPYRTFREVRQPESPFVLRFNDDGQAALFTGDGSGWQLEAVATIRDYLAAALEGTNLDVIA